MLAPGPAGPGGGFQGEGLLAVDPGDGGPVRLYAAAEPRRGAVDPGVLCDGRVLVGADGPVEHVDGAVGRAGAWPRGRPACAGRAGAGPVRPAPTIWCSWYHYFTEVTEADVLENLDAIGRLDLPVDVIQIDDGWQAEIGDWLTLSGRFPLAARARRPDPRRRPPGRHLGRALPGGRAQRAVAREHPDWLVRADGRRAGHNWDQDLLRAGHHPPGRRAPTCGRSFGRLRALGFDYFKIDFLYAGALDGGATTAAALAAYRPAWRLIRDAIGPSATCSAAARRCCPASGWSTRCGSPRHRPAYEPRRAAIRPGRRSSAPTLSTVGPRLPARPVLGQRPRLPDRPARRAAPRGSGPRWCSGTAGCAPSSDRIADLDDWGPGHHPPRLLGSVPPTPPYRSPASKHGDGPPGMSRTRGRLRLPGAGARRGRPRPPRELAMRKIIYWVHASIDGHIAGAGRSSSTGPSWARTCSPTPRR